MGSKLLTEKMQKIHKSLGLSGNYFSTLLWISFFCCFFSLNKLNQCSKTAFCIHSGYIKFVSNSENVTKILKQKEFEDKADFHGTYIKMTWIWNFVDFKGYKIKITCSGHV